MEKVGVIGCGAMGRGIVKNLINHGYEVLVYDVNQEAVKHAHKLGAKPRESVVSLASEVKVLITSLPSAKILEETISEESGGALQVMQSESYIVDMSTMDVETTRKMYLQAKKKGIFFYDSPISGGPQGADAGTLTIMVGGDKEKFDAILPILQALGKEVRFIGESGSGQVVKLCNNMVVAGITALVSEAFLTGVKAGVPVETIAELMQMGSAQNKVLSVFGPNIIEDTHENIIFLLSHMAKDIDLYMELAKQGNIPTLVSSNIQQLYQIARVKGKGGLDTTAVSQVLEELSNQKIKFT